MLMLRVIAIARVDRAVEVARALTGRARPEFGMTSARIQLMRHGNDFIAALAMSALVLALSGCQKQEGPAEQAGKEVDKAVEKAGQQIEKAGEKIQDAAKGSEKK